MHLTSAKVSQVKRVLMINIMMNLWWTLVIGGQSLALLDDFDISGLPFTSYLVSSLCDSFHESNDPCSMADDYNNIHTVQFTPNRLWKRRHGAMMLQSTQMLADASPASSHPMSFT